MAGFVYNPAESIKQDFQQTGSAMGNIFAQVIQQQQRDYTLAENTFANIEALKKDLNIYGQKSISEKANALLGHASASILQNGKIDYSKMGEIRQAVSDIKDLKTGYDLGAKEYERMLQIGLANKENLTSFEGFYKDLSAKMSDENLIKNPRDLQAALADTYTKSLDATKMFGKAFLAANPYQPFSKDIKDSKGNLVRIQGELPAGWSADADGKLIPPAPVTVTNADGTTSTIDYADKTVAQLKATNPDVLAAMRRQSGAWGENLTDKQLVEYYTTKVPMVAKSQQVKSAAGIKGEEAQADILGFKAEHQLEEFNLDKLKSLTAIRASEASIKKDLALAKKANGEGFGSKNLSDFGITNDGFYFGDEITVPVKTAKGQTSYVKASKFKWSPDGKLMVEGVPGKTDAMTNVFVPTGGVQLYPADANTLAGFKMAVNNMGPDKQANISTGYALFNSLPRPKTSDELLSGFGANRAPKTADDLINYIGTPKPKSAPAPTSTKKPIVSAGKNWTPVE
jgi:flagellar basal body rod protein FlgF